MASRLPAQPPVLSGFQYIRPLGTGGFADVFLFEQDMPRRPVAVKVLLTDIVDDNLLRMFNAEADAMARLSAHPSILTIYEASISADGRPYIVMEYCPSSFTSRYRQEVIPVSEVLSLGIRMGSAVETAHRAGLLHRDIKPSNILVTNYGSPVLSDFGIATTVGPDTTGDDVIAMSVPWSAPEVVAELEAGSVASEVWSFGATLYTLLAGVSPFERAGRGMNQRELLKKRIAQATYTPTGRAEVSARLETLLRVAMMKRPSDRFQSVLELVEELQEVQREMGLPVTALEITEDKWKPVTGSTNVSDPARGPIRSVVTHTSQRVPKQERARTDSHSQPRSEVPGSEETRTGITGGRLALIIAGTVVVTAAGVVALLQVFGGL